MVVSQSVRVSSGIRCTQVGYPRANREEGVLHAVSADRVAGLAGLAVAKAEDKEVSEAEVGIGGVIEGCGDQKSHQCAKMRSRAVVVLLVCAVRAMCSAARRSRRKAARAAGGAVSRVRAADMSG